MVMNPDGYRPGWVEGWIATRFKSRQADFLMSDELFDVATLLPPPSITMGLLPGIAPQCRGFASVLDLHLFKYGVRFLSIDKLGDVMPFIDFRSNSRLRIIGRLQSESMFYSWLFLSIGPFCP